MAQGQQLYNLATVSPAEGDSAITKPIGLPVCKLVQYERLSLKSFKLAAFHSYSQSWTVLLDKEFLREQALKLATTIIDRHDVKLLADCCTYNDG